MVYHDWSETGFDWHGLGEAGILIKNTCQTWGRLTIFTKEKYGTLRASVYFWSGSLHSLLYPGYVSCQYFKKYPRLRDWLWSFDLKVITLLTYYSGLLFLFTKWQKFVYNKAYQRALKKYPHLRAEILYDADFLEFIEGAEDILNKYHKEEKQEFTNDDR